MSNYLADEVHSRLGKAGRVLMLGLTFKKDVPDLRNSKVVNDIERLKWIGHEVTIHDPLADPQEAAHEYGLKLDAAALDRRSEEHTSERKSLMRISYAIF